MALFKILQGSSSRIDQATTPLHEGWCYFTPDDGKFYIDSVVDDTLERVCINDDEISWVLPEISTYDEIIDMVEAGYAPMIQSNTGFYSLGAVDPTAQVAVFSRFDMGGDLAVDTYTATKTTSGTDWASDHTTFVDAAHVIAALEDI